MEQQALANYSMSCPYCKSESKRFGKHRNGLQRFRCTECKRTFTEDHELAFRIEDYLNESRGIMAIQLLVEGCSIRTTERITGLHRDAITRLLLAAGARAQNVMDTLVQNVKATDVQADEIWGFIGKKEKKKLGEDANDDTLGDCYTWVAMDRNLKIILAFAVGRRTLANAQLLMGRLRFATCAKTRFQLSTDGLEAYKAAVDEFVGDRCDFAQLVKTYAQPQENEKRYSPAVCTGAKKVVVSGNPLEANICTSHIERQNLTMRMSIRRLTRLTNAFSKKIENHEAAIALHFAYTNFCRIHQTLRVTPAMEAGITDHVWTLAELMAG